MLPTVKRLLNVYKLTQKFLKFLAKPDYEDYPFCVAS
jgi:hypothetical protein